MSKNIFLVINGHFPRGGAGTNYIQYLSLALLDQGWNVMVIGEGENNPNDLADSGYEYHGIHYDNIEIPKNKVKAAITHKFRYGKMVEKKLRQLGFDREDYLIFYTYCHNGINHVVKKMPEVNRDHVSVCCVEWFEPDKYKLGRLDPLYWEYHSTFTKVFTISKRVIPISTELNTYFQSVGCKTLLLPILADPYEFECHISKPANDKIKFIYSGAATNKDSFDVMLEAILHLSDAERSRVEFHITKMTTEKLRGILGKKSYLIDKLKDNLVLYNWMTYEKLIELYQEMDFLLIARENRLSTRANFPSKIPELMSFGVIPVCSDVGDCPRDYLTDGKNSIIFKGCSVEECCNGIRRALSLNDEIRQTVRKNARQCVIDKFFYKNWSKKIDDFILNK